MVYRSWEVAGLAVEMLIVFLLSASHRVISHKLSTDGSSSFPLKAQTFLSPPITLSPGEVSNQYYRMDSFPKGHIAIKAVEAEMVDEQGKPVPLTEVYLHHWTIDRVFVGDKPHPKSVPASPFFNGTVVLARNDGICQDGSLGHFFGSGSEARLGKLSIPAPYGIVVGDPTVPPEGFHERWLLNVHVIDTRSTLDRKGCTECRCTLYGHVDLSKRAANYTGGLLCCDHGDKCALKPGESPPGKKTYSLKYTVHWVDCNEDVVPVRVYVLDVTDTGDRQVGKFAGSSGCRVDYEVPACDQLAPGLQKEPCVHTLKANLPPFPKGGSVVYAIGHQHAAGIGITLYGEGGGEICTSEPFYGSGASAGDEAGYIVGMADCYPHSVKVRTDEKLQLHSRYNSFEGHTGVMGLFYLLVAD